MRIDNRTARTLGTVAAAIVLALAWWALGSGGGGDNGGSSTPSTSGSTDVGVTAGGAIAEADLPVEARDTLTLIDQGGPYPYPDHDGGVFGNYEGLLPDEPSGYYHEYTVKDPDQSDRGPWRIITGSPDEFYWTPDHYEHFFRIVRS